jgi:glucose/arabinose dehydrogenase
MKRFILLVIAGVALSACQRPANGSSATPQGTAPPQTATSAKPAAANASTAMRVEQIAHGLEHPWAIALLPDGSFLVTERAGRMRRVGADGALSTPLAGVPKVFAQGQGGLLDVVLAPDFATSRRIYFSYAEPGDDDTAGTA